jgi:hypothetical protein
VQINRSGRETAVFVLKWMDIEKLLGDVAQYLPKMSISASCTDRLNRTFADIEELKKFSNSQRAAIAELEIIASDEKRSQRFSMALSNDERHNVRISLDADESVAIHVSDLYQDFLDSVRPWYSWIACANWYFVVWGIVFFVLFGSLAIASFNLFSALSLLDAKSIPLKWRNFELTGTIFLNGFLISLLPPFVGTAMNWFRSKFFPMGTFAFGDGENRHNRDEVIRNVLTAFAVSVVSSLVVSCFSVIVPVMLNPMG